MADDPTQPERPQPPDYTAGQVIADKYRLERLLGEGGQACVWQAKNLMLDADVAIKVVRAGVRDPAHAQRLLQEARTAARLDHSAVVRIYDLGQTTAGDQFLVMELLEGDPLADHLQVHQRLSAIDAVRILLPIAEALALAHSRGLIHRDVKPDNVLLARTSGSLQPKLLDFGVVKQQNTSDPSRGLTETGAIVGTPAYFSPEQAAGREDLDERADVWGYAAMLYECLTGELPFKGQNYNALLRSILEDAPRPLSEYGIQDAELWRILERGLTKPLDQRWQSMVEMGRALAQWLLSQGVVDDVCRSSLHSKWLAEAATLPSTGARHSEVPRDSSVPGPVVRAATSAPSASEDRAFVAHPSDSPSAGSGLAQRRSRIALAAAACALIGVGVVLSFVAFDRRPPLKTTDARERTLVIDAVTPAYEPEGTASAGWRAADAGTFVEPVSSAAVPPSIGVASRPAGEPRLEPRPQASSPARPQLPPVDRVEPPRKPAAPERPPAPSDDEFDLLPPY